MTNKPITDSSKLKFNIKCFEILKLCSIYFSIKIYIASGPFKALPKSNEQNLFYCYFHPTN